MKHTLRHSLLASVLMLSSASALADTGVGAGVSYVFGQGMAVGVKIFSDDEESEVVASAGVDYLINARTWRPNIGIGYLGNSYYSDVTVGYSLKESSFDFAVSGGYADTKDGSSNRATSGNTGDGGGSTGGSGVIIGGAGGGGGGPA